MLRSADVCMLNPTNFRLRRCWCSFPYKLHVTVPEQDDFSLVALSTSPCVSVNNVHGQWIHYSYIPENITVVATTLSDKRHPIDSVFPRPSYSLVFLLLRGSLRSQARVVARYCLGTAAMLKEKSKPTVWPSYLWSYRLIVMLVPALMANAQGKDNHIMICHIYHILCR